MEMLWRTLLIIVRGRSLLAGRGVYGLVVGFRLEKSTYTPFNKEDQLVAYYSKICQTELSLN